MKNVTPEMESGDVRKLPLWKSWLEENATRITYGASFTSRELVDYIGLSEDSIGFAMSISNIRRALRWKGMHFTARGQHGTGYCITQPNANHNEIDRLRRLSQNALREGVILGTNTPLELLTPEERRIHESLTEKMAARLALVSRRIAGNTNKKLRGPSDSNDEDAAGAVAKT